MRSRDPATIRDWFRERPGMNYAVIPGEDFVVLDLDVKKDKNGAGDLDYAAAMAEDFTDSHVETMTVTTPSTNSAGEHGEHRFFKAPYPIASTHTLPKSIDVRGNDGYIVGPGCATSRDPINGVFAGEYRFKNTTDIAPLPEWVLPRLNKWVPREDRASYEDSVEEIDGKFFVDGVELDTPQLVERASEWLQHGAVPAVSGDSGNATTYKTFAWLREHGIGVSKALELVLDFYNPRCTDKVTGESYPWERSELAHIRDNAYKYAKKGVSEAGGMMDRGLTEAEIVASSQDVNELLMQFKSESEVAGLRISLNTAIEQRKIDDSLDAITWEGDAIFNYPAKKEYVIPSVLPAYGYVGFISRRGTGKTTMMYDMAMRLAHDRDWHGQPMKMGWGALVIAGEDPESAQDQIRALMQTLEIETLDPERFILITGIMNLLDPASVDKWIKHFKKKVKDRRFVVFVDTWQLATASGKQNDDDTMQMAIASTKRLAKAINGPGVMAAHPPKSKNNEDTWSGAAVMENHSQALWRLSEETFGVKFSVPRIKGTSAGYTARFEFAKHLLGGTDEWGKPNLGIVPAKIGGEGYAQSVADTEKNISIRKTYAAFIYSLMSEAEAQEDDFAKKRTSAFSIAGTARRVMTAAEQGRDGGLGELGEKLGSVESVKTRLEELFRLQKTPVLVDNIAGTPIKIYLHNVPGKQSFYFRIAEVSSKEREAYEELRDLPDA